MSYPQEEARANGAGLSVPAVFLSFASGYCLSYALRSVNAALAPYLNTDLGLSTAGLGGLSAVYFIAFAALQWPLGHWLDRYGARRINAGLLVVAALGAAIMAASTGLLLAAIGRALIGAGVAACLMAPLTAYRHHYSPAAQLRANSWMLMTGSLGMLASTLPVQWLLPLIGWRGLFWALAAALALAMALMLWLVPRDPATPAGAAAAAASAGRGATGYGEILRHPQFLRLVPLAIVQHGGLIAVQALWAGPWLTVVGGRTPAEATAGLFAINLSMLLTFLTWGAVMPRLAARGVTALQVLRWGMPAVLILLAHNVWAGQSAGPLAWAAWCVCCTCVSLIQPALAQAFPPAQAGRALSAYNLLIFAGVFSVQWGIGLAINALQAAGWAPATAFRIAFAGFGLLCAAAYAWFLLRRA